jgi:hypothetical protein
MAFVALGVLGLIAVMLLGKLFVAANPAALAQGLRWAGAAVTSILMVGLLLRGQLVLSAALFPVHYLLWRGWRAPWVVETVRQARRGSEKASTIKTAFLTLTLDHDSGALAGKVRRGRWRGRRVETLSQAELVALWHETSAADPPSAQLVETCLERSFPDWRAAAGGADAGAANGGAGAAPRGRAGAMTRAEALRILELGEAPAPTEIVEAHRRLMMANHPDHGGSAYLAALINEAKEVLTRPR